MQIFFSKIFSHIANYFRNENFKILVVKKKELNSIKNVLNIRILIIKYSDYFLYQLLKNKDIGFWLFLFFKILQYGKTFLKGITCINKIFKN